MSDLAETNDPTQPLERVACMDEPGRTNTALAIAERALRVLGVVMQRAGHDLLFVRDEELASMEPGNVNIGKSKDGLIPVLLDM